jgi:hypothetical protein
MMERLQTIVLALAAVALILLVVVQWSSERGASQAEMRDGDADGG